MAKSQGKASGSLVSYSSSPSLFPSTKSHDPIEMTRVIQSIFVWAKIPKRYTCLLSRKQGKFIFGGKNNERCPGGAILNSLSHLEGLCGININGDNLKTIHISHSVYHPF